MKKKLTAEQIVALHIASDELCDIADLTGDYRTHNREFKKKLKLFDILKDDIELAKVVYDGLLEYDNITTKTSAAASCLKLGIYVNRAEQTLEEISRRNDIGIRRGNAEMTLMVWRGDVPGKTL